MSETCLRTGHPDTVCISAIRSEVHCGAPRGSKARSRGVTQRHGWYVLACLLSREERGRLSSILTLSSSKPCCAGIEAMLAACMAQQAAYRPKNAHHRLSGGGREKAKRKKSKCRGCRYERTNAQVPTVTASDGQPHVVLRRRKIAGAHGAPSASLSKGRDSYGGAVFCGLLFNAGVPAAIAAPSPSSLYVHSTIMTTKHSNYFRDRGKIRR